MIIRRDDITAREVRSKLREPNNLSDDLFVSFCVSLGVLNSGFKSDQLREVKRIVLPGRCQLPRGFPIFPKEFNLIDYILGCWYNHVNNTR